MSVITVETKLTYRSLMHKSKSDLADLVLFYADRNEELRKRLDAYMFPPMLDQPGGRMECGKVHTIIPSLPPGHGGGVQTGDPGIREDEDAN